MAAQRWRLVARRRNPGDLLQTHAIDGDYIAGLIEPNVENRLRRRLRIGKGERTHVARDIVPVLIAELCREAGATKRAFYRSAIVDSGLDRVDQQFVDLISLMGADARAAGCAQDKRAKADGKQQMSAELTHELLLPGRAPENAKTKAAIASRGPAINMEMREPRQGGLRSVQPGNRFTMPNLFQRLFARTDPKDALQPLYQAIVHEGRQPHWYLEGQVPDTMDGRFDMIVAILAQVLMRLEALDAAQESVWLTELFVDDMDGQLRQEGIGDVVVGKHIGRMVSALGGRLSAYRAALLDEAELREALVRNLYRGVAPSEDAVTHVESCLRSRWIRLGALSRDALLTGDLG